MTSSSGSIYKDAAVDSISQFNAAQAAEAKEDIQEAFSQTVGQAQDEKLEDQFDEARNPTAAAFRSAQKNSIKVPKKKEELKGEKKGTFRSIEAIKNGIEDFFNKNPQFLANVKLKKNKILDELPQLTVELEKGLAEGWPKEKILTFIQEKYPDPINASLVLQILVSLFEGDNKNILASIWEAVNTSYINAPREEADAKAKAEAEQATKKATLDVTLQAFKIVQDGDLDKLLDHFKSYPIEATEIFKVLNGPYDDLEKLKPVEKYLIRKLGEEIAQIGKDGLKKAGSIDGEDRSHLTNAWTLERKLVALSSIDNYFAKRNPAPKADKGKRNAAAAA